MGNNNVFRFSVKKESNDAEKLLDMNAVEEVIKLSTEAVEIYKTFEKDLLELDVVDNGRDGLKKFIFDQFEKVEQDGKIRHIRVIDENGLADMVIEKTVEDVHAKARCDYFSSQVDWEACKDVIDVIYVNRDHPDFEDITYKAAEYGVKKIESTICTSLQCEELTELMRMEEKITGNAKSVFIPHAYTQSQAMQLIQLRGVISAKACARLGGAVAIETNFVDVIMGKKTIQEAAKDVAKANVEKALINYAGNQLLSTAVGQVAKKALIKVGKNYAKTVIGSTGLSASAITGISAADAVASAIAKDAILTSSGIAAATITEVGGAVASVASTAGLAGAAGTISAVSAGAASAIGTAAMLATPLAPVAIGTAAVYGASKLFKKLF